MRFKINNIFLINIRIKFNKGDWNCNKSLMHAFRVLVFYKKHFYSDIKIHEIISIGMFCLSYYKKLMHNFKKIFLHKYLIFVP